MEELFERSKQKVQYIPTDFVRSLMDEINWNSRLIGIRGARGVGKTTLLLQYMKLKLPHDYTVLYVNLDNIYFAEHKLYYLTDTFVKKGGKTLLLDEVHKYPNWSQELKNIYDDFPGLKVIFTACSLLEIFNSRADLSRRAIVYDMQGFSFREYLNYKMGTSFQTVTLNKILESHISVSEKVISQIKVFEHFPDYLKNGYYPFYKETSCLYQQRISEIINLVLEIELPMLRSVEMAYVPKVKQLLQIISESVPFVPNITKLSERIGIAPKSLLVYLSALGESHLIQLLHKSAAGISKFQKPNQILLENTNLIYTLSIGGNVLERHVRETFFVNQLKKIHRINYTDKGDILVDEKYNFEIESKAKDKSQIKWIKNSYVVTDNIEFGFGNKIPLWQFGFLY